MWEEIIKQQAREKAYFELKEELRAAASKGSSCIYESKLSAESAVLVVEYFEKIIERKFDAIKILLEAIDVSRKSITLIDELITTSIQANSYRTTGFLLVKLYKVSFKNLK